MLNVLNLDSNDILLGCNVKNYLEAYKWLLWYKANYTNNFVLVRQCECCGKYSVIN